MAKIHIMIFEIVAQRKSYSKIAYFIDERLHLNFIEFKDKISLTISRKEMYGNEIYIKSN